MEKKKKDFKFTGMISLVLMGVLLIMQFLPYWTFKDGSEKCSVSMWEYVAFPSNYEKITNYFEHQYRTYFKENYEKEFKAQYSKQLDAYYKARSASLSDARIIEYIEAALKDFYTYNGLERFYDEQFKDYLRENYNPKADKDFADLVKGYSEEQLAEIYNLCFLQHSEEYFKKYSKDYFNIMFETDYVVNEKGYRIDTMVVIPWGILLCLIFGIVCKLMGLDLGVNILATACGFIGVCKYIGAYRGIGILTMSKVWGLHMLVFVAILILGVWGLVNFLSTKYSFKFTRKYGES
ncbi:MAG: hypothetical protein IKT58_03875 [Oscillospiraceae bacterium]|nr:hypothetical protein [Oscillospiraceae bacterium]